MNNSLAEVHPELVSEWSEKNLTLTPDDITFGSNKKVWWRGACGHEWQTSVKARSNGEKCTICSGARVIAGINDFIHYFQLRLRSLPIVRFGGSVRIAAESGTPLFLPVLVAVNARIAVGTYS